MTFGAMYFNKMKLEITFRLIQKSVSIAATELCMSPNEKLAGRDRELLQPDQDEIKA